MTLWPGTCIVHEQFCEREILKLKAKHPDAKLAAHPECPEAILQVRRSRRIDALDPATTSRRRRSQTFLIATEEGILHQMKKLAPDREFIPVPPDNGCRVQRVPVHEAQHAREALPVPARRASRDPPARGAPQGRGEAAAADARAFVPERRAHGTDAISSAPWTRCRGEALDDAPAPLPRRRHRTRGRDDRGDGAARGESRGRNRGEVRMRRLRSPGRPSRLRAPRSRARLVARSAGRRRRLPARRARPARGPSALDPDRGARRAEPAAADERHRDGNAALRRRRGRHRLPDSGHPQDGARPASLRPPGRPGRRRRQSPIRSDGDGPHQGQPPPPRRRRRAGRGRGARARLHPERPSKSRSSRRTTSRRRSRRAPSGS